MRPVVAVFVAFVADVLGGSSVICAAHADEVNAQTESGLHTEVARASGGVPATLAAAYWHHRPEMLESSVDLPSYCGGAYVEREFDYPLTIDSSTHAIVGSATRLRGNVDGVVELIGDVELQQGNRYLAADLVAVDHPKSTAAMPNKATLVEPGIAMRGADGMIDFANSSARMNQAEFVLFDAHMRGTSEVLEKQAATLRLTRTGLTSCRPGSDTWLFSAKRVDIHDGDVFATARGAALEVLGVPVFYTPYIRFPITDERVSGFLFPALGYGDDDGLDMALPYYINLAPNYDATITPRLMSRRGVGLETEFRLKNGWSDSLIGGAFLADDDQYDGTLSREDFIATGSAGDFIPADRWLLGLEHDGRIGAWSTLVDYVSVSDIDYYSDLGSDLDTTSQVSLERRGELQYANGGLFARVWAQSFQILEDRPEPYQRLPEFNATYIREAGPVSLSLAGAWTRFDRQSHPRLSGLDLITGERVHIEPRIQIPLRRPWGFLTLTGGGRYTEYDLENDPSGEPLETERSVGLASVDAGLIFDRDTHYLGGEAAVQTLEPRLYYLYQEYTEQDGLPRFDTGPLSFRFTQLFRNNRFSGLDRIGDADQVSVGLTSRFISSGSGRQLARFDVGTIVHLRDRRVTLDGEITDDELAKTSEIVAAAQFRLGRHFKATTNVLWDASENEIDEAGVSLGWSSDRRRVLHVGYRRQVHQNIDQTDLGIYWPLHARVSFIGKWNHDWQFGQNVESFAGLEYASCCLQVRAVWRKFIVTSGNRIVAEALDDEGIVVQFVFRGLAGFGNKLDSLLRHGIRGYRPENDNDSYGFMY